MSKLLSNTEYSIDIEYVALSLGSNMGEREANILDVLEILDTIEGISMKAVSSLYESEPVGEGFGGNFINAVCTLVTIFKPKELIAVCKGLEMARGRDLAKSGSPRIIDIDILMYGRMILREKNLIIPHPRLLERKFVLIPFSEIAPQWIVPGTERSVKENMESLRIDHFVRLASSRKILSIKG